MKKQLDAILKNIKVKYSYLKLSEIQYLELIKLACKHKNMESFIDRIVKAIVSKNTEEVVPEFMQNITREQIISNYIDDNLNYSKDVNDNLIQVTHLISFYKLISNEEELISLTSNLLLNNKKLKKIINNIRINNDKASTNNKYIQIMLDSYSTTFQDELIQEDYYDIKDSFSIYRNDIRNLPTYTEVEKQELLIKALNGDEKAKQRFIEANLKLVIAIAINYRKYCPRDFMDLIQNGNEGLLKAFDKYDITKGYKFSTYATIWIRKKVLDCIQQKNSIRIPDWTYLKVKKVLDCQAWLCENNIPITPENISQKTKFSIKEVNRLLSVPLTVGSLDIPITDDEQDGKTIVDTIETQYDLIQLVEDKMIKEEFYNIFNKMSCNKESKDKSKLTEREKEILFSYFGIGVEKMTYSEIGKKLHISTQGVQQNLKNTLKKIRFSEYITDLSALLDNCSLVKKKII